MRESRRFELVGCLVAIGILAGSGVARATSPREPPNCRVSITAGTLPANAPGLLITTTDDRATSAVALEVSVAGVFRPLEPPRLDANGLRFVPLPRLAVGPHTVRPRLTCAGGEAVGTPSEYELDVTAEIPFPNEVGAELVELPTEYAPTQRFRIMLGPAMFDFMSAAVFRLRVEGRTGPATSMRSGRTPTSFQILSR